MIKQYNKLEDNEIIKLCLNGEKAAFNEIVARYKNLVYSVILRMITDGEEANDLAQEVFIKVYKNLNRYSSEFKLSTWIIRITTNHVIDYRRKKKQETVSIDELVYEPTDYQTPEKSYLQSEQRKGLAALVNGLPEMYKVPIVLYHQQGLSYQEIAEVTQEPLSKVKNRIFRGRKMLKESILGMKEGGRIGLQES